jgi:hypothetical protein
MAKEDIVLVFENIGGVDEDIHMLSKNPTTNYTTRTQFVGGSLYLTIFFPLISRTHRCCVASFID